MAILVVPDSSVISVIVELGCYEHVRKLAVKNEWIILVPDLVIEETKDIVHFPLLVKKASFNSVKVDSVTVASLRNRFPALGDGELSVLSLAMNFRRWGINTESATVVFDDKAARKVARSLGVPCLGTLRVLKLMQEARILSKRRFLGFCARLQASGFRFNEKILRDLMLGSQKG